MTVSSTPTPSTTTAGSASRPPQAAGTPLKALPLRRPGRWLLAVVAVVALGGTAWSLAKNPNMDWPTIGRYLFKELTLRGLWVTLYLTVAAMLIGVAGGILVAVMRLSDNPVLSRLAGLYVWVFRGTPILVQLIFWGFLGALYADLKIGIPFTSVTFWSAPTSQVITATAAALLGLGLNEIAYASEIIRGGILGVDEGQTEAAHSLGMSPSLTMRRIVLPQAMRVLLPPMGNEVITMLKTTALVSVISGRDLLTRLQEAYSQNFKVIPLLVVASLWYLALTSLLAVPQSWLERKYSRGASRSAAEPSVLRRLLAGTRRAGAGDAR